jgi:CDP-diacylglycerol--glycerol-3-phosphate 3-phosphatidyltransferase
MERGNYFDAHDNYESLNKSNKISLHGLAIKSILSPEEFHEHILHKINECQRDIILSSLYFDHKEKILEILESIQIKLINNKNIINVTILLDYNRMHRRDSEQSLEYLKQLSQLSYHHNQNFNVYYYRMPQSYYFLPSQLNEIIGVYHCKFLIFDNEIILTGANLSEEYFMTRQDRYLIFTYDESIQSNESLPIVSLDQYMRLFVHDLSKFCYFLSNGVMMPPKSENITELNRLLKTYTTNEFHFDNDTIMIPMIQHAAVGIYNEENNILQLLSRLTSGNADRTDNRSVNRQLTMTIASPYPNFSSSLVEAIIKLSHQMISETVSSLLTNTKSENTAVEFLHRHISFVFASNSSHGFSKGNFIKSFIPSMHQIALFNEISCAVKRNSSVSQLINLWNYDKPNWTFHLKGMWIFGSSNEANKARVQRSNNEDNLLYQSESMPSTNCSIEDILRQEANHMITYIGSSNFSIRSWKRDFEFGFLIFTKNDAHHNFFINEFNHFKKYLYPFQNEWKESRNLKGPNEMGNVSCSCKLLLRTATKIFRSYL